MLYRVTSVNVTDWTEEVEADSVEDAMFQIEGGGYLCHQCAHERNDGEWEPEIVSDVNGNVLFDKAAEDQAELRNALEVIRGVREYAEKLASAKTWDGREAVVERALGRSILEKLEHPGGGE
ncbi:hypothetical protein SEA_BANTAM_54 [Gordonia phage Bantam]|uniref:Uncharacterized protein n=1 Tax=Gordonia phage Bantam TaxID=1887641 RepID=A0A1B3AYC3_9CAUD|nr:hypothetical protein BIZ77_gp124 [Gordonia phage Bantam]AOE43744.1 hypothetical protein SEA_BANTAM_54 [Gordonia phage Bantam]